jgi:hypothetical protein
MSATLAITVGSRVDSVTGIAAIRNSAGVRWGVAAICAAVFLYFLPLFHVVSLKEVQQQIASQEFNAAEYVDTFWHGPLLERTRSAIDAADLLAAFAQDFDDTAERFGHRLGLSGHSSYLVSGKGEIIAIENTAVSIALHDGDPAAVIIETGPV